MKQEETDKVLTNSLNIIWILVTLVFLWKLGFPQVQMSSGSDYFLYVYKSSSFWSFLFFSSVVLVDRLLCKLSSLNKIICKGVSVGTVLILSFGLSFIISFDDLYKELVSSHLSINEYRRCDDGYEPGYKSSFNWVLVSKNLSDCNRLRVGVKSTLLNDTRYKDYEARIEELKNPVDIVDSSPKESSTPKATVNVESTSKFKPTPSPAPTVKPTPRPTPRPTFKVAHRFLFYGEGDVMISSFKYLPPSVLKKIEAVTKNEATEEYKKVDLTKYIPEMMKSFGLTKYKAVTYQKEFKFKFSKATLIHSLKKGDCTNYPDTFISLVSNDFKKTINGKEYVGYPEIEFKVMPEATRKIEDEERVKALNKKMVGIYNPNDPISDKPQYYSVDGKTYAFLGEMAMGTFYVVYDCTKEKCLKADYYVKYPACGS
jgi:hypothetical protein